MMNVNEIIAGSGSSVAFAAVTQCSDAGIDKRGCGGGNPPSRRRRPFQSVRASTGCDARNTVGSCFDDFNAGSPTRTDR